jgi:glycosyltransferase involved in cell wall biosynthesis
MRLAEPRLETFGTDPAAADLRVLVLAPYPRRRAPSQRFRFEQHLAPLTAAGIHLEVSSFLTPQGMDALYRSSGWAAKAQAVGQGFGRRLRDAARARRYDLVLVHREATPAGYPIVEGVLDRLGVPYLFDFDDAIYLSHSTRANRALAVLKRPSKAATIARRAALVVAGCEHLADWARRHCSNIRVIPTTIDTDSYTPGPAVNAEPERLCVGWSGSLTTIDYLDLIAPVLRELQRDRGVRLRVIGDAAYRIEGAEVEALPWNEATEVEDLREIDIGLYPLPDDEWARGKCGLKPIQYMALGIPTVMSPIGASLKIARGGAAVLASSPEEWATCLRELLDDPGRRTRLGEAGRQRVEDEYSTRVTTPAWIDALRTATGHPSA